ncbi:sigma 54 modulation/S30EA-like ribosomal protein [Prosthecobacter fusiformis]|uniref:Sigma 54 modulation/S30EA-like ribosomal protein n=1 Tax=Prosthecobacter fusiformis TaxID=48464 RepID=A0A4R7RKJ6_9BACT|nr:HPF/RaiA family ribosome-associated protein [Prosthecobacter fusiformis]TDU64236.1 sigma 54 modulation/S30EA-like ribosomal protein [Prosthecobacter fusiformis]
MIIQVNTDHHITGRQEFIAEAESIVTDALSHVSDHITRVEVHLNDENSKKSGPEDKRCMMEARLEGHQPIAVTHKAETLAFAMDGAAEKLKTAVEHTVDRLQRH